MPDGGKASVLFLSQWMKPVLKQSALPELNEMLRTVLEAAQAQNMISFSRTGLYLSTVREISKVRLTFAGNNTFWSVIQKRVDQQWYRKRTFITQDFILLKYRWGTLTWKWVIWGKIEDLVHVYLICQITFASIELK